MILDTHFSIGKTHKVCEDYVTMGYRPVPYIIVSDGCSSSENTDVGARLLSWAMAKSIKCLYNKTNQLPFDYNVLGHTAIAMARSMTDALGLQSSATDATIVLAFYHNEYIWVYMYGDGVIMLSLLDGTFDFFDVNCAFKVNGIRKEQPYYLSYLVDPYRRSLYLDTVIESNLDKTIKTIYNHVRRDNVRMIYDAAVIKKFSVHDYKTIAIASDGITTFLDASKGEAGKVPLEESVPLFINFKGTKGEFLKRRAKKQIETYHKKGIQHIDDFSIGAFTELQPRGT